MTSNLGIVLGRAGKSNVNLMAFFLSRVFFFWWCGGGGVAVFLFFFLFFFFFLLFRYYDNLHHFQDESDKNSHSDVHFLPAIIENYGHCLHHGSSHIFQALPRLLTLWLDNTSK